MIVKTIRGYANYFAYKVNKIFDDIHCDTLEYYFYDKENDNEYDYNKGFGKIFPKGIRNYKPAEYVNFDLSDDDCPDNWDDYNSLAKFETDDGNYVIVWTAIDTLRKTMYAFISK